MKTIRIVILLVIAVVTISCSNDDEPKNHAPISEDKEISISENSTSDIVATIDATDIDGDDLIFAIVSQNPTGSVIINDLTGEVFMADINAFDYEQNTLIIVVVNISDGSTTTEMQLTINILDVNEAD
ncbi:cadherin repeat domain-containing protein [Winogradskyella sp.]|uniref:cadherin repeat domain-containing protein n=1 Tax=Winogradskyella sp. TaxID=1883156 RepID=UPI0025F43D2F|nr:cadherin repeat domain-containing protein [Winogradskyella sp.]